MGDWQFWLVTAIAVLAAALVARAALPPRFLRRRKGTRAPLTVGGKPVGGERR